jgi:hypothetical protein
MANQLILPPQKFNLKDITDQFPGTGSPKKKVFFQAELRSLANNNATFGVIAYPAWRKKKKWEVGTKISGVDTGQAKVENFVTPVAFANNEIVVTLDLSKKKKKKKKDPKGGRWCAFEDKARKACKDAKQLEQATLVFEASISENPHLEYDVTLDTGTSSYTTATKPSPPAPPEA